MNKRSVISILLVGILMANSTHIYCAEDAGSVAKRTITNSLYIILPLAIMRGQFFRFAGSLNAFKAIPHTAGISAAFTIGPFIKYSLFATGAKRLFDDHQKLAELYKDEIEQLKQMPQKLKSLISHK